MITSRRKLVLALDHRITQTRMNDQFNEPNVDHGPAMPDRRKFLVAGMGLVAAPWLTRAAAGAPAARTDTPVGKNPFSVRAWGAGSATSPLGAMEIERRAIGANDVLLDVLYCGICNSDIHQARDEWASWNPTRYPCVPGHEFIGQVQAVGSAVTKFRVGDIGGVGCMVNSCGTCENCLGGFLMFYAADKTKLRRALIASRIASKKPPLPTIRPTLQQAGTPSAVIRIRSSSPSIS